ncbi:MAG: heavy-metal-associated domain-containing protein, partial [Nitrospirales bacterium]
MVLAVSLVLGTALPVLAQQAPPPGSTEEIIVRVDGASCPFCAFGLEKRLGRLDGVANVRIELKAGEAILTLNKG